MCRIKLFQAALSVCLLTLTPSAPAAHVNLLRSPDGGIQPQAAVDSRGVVHLIYFKGDPAAGDIFYVQQAPVHTTFSNPIKVNSAPGAAIALGTIRGAQLAIGKNNRVHVAWNGHAPTNGTYLDAPMCYTRLTDAGTGFEPQQNVIHYARGLDGGGSLAADKEGNVYVMWHAPIPGTAPEEGNRGVFIARSTDEGKTFAREQLASNPQTGACGCCGMRAFVDAQGDVFALYRSASQMVNRNEVLLMSHDRGTRFETIYEHPWRVSTCPMSSAFITQSGKGVVAAAETHERVFFVHVDPATGKTSEPVSPEGKAKHPVAVANNRGEVLFVWTEDTAWAKGGKIAWQLYDKNDKPISEISRAEGLPAWSLATAFPQPSGDFVIVY